MPQIDGMLMTQIALTSISGVAAAFAWWNAKSAKRSAGAAERQATAAEDQAKHAAESVKLARQANELVARQVTILESANVTRLRASLRFEDGPFGANSPVPIVNIVNEGNLSVTIDAVVFLTRTGDRIEGKRTWKGHNGPYLPRPIDPQHRIDAFWDRDLLKASFHYLHQPISLAIKLSNGNDYPGLDEAQTRPFVDQFIRAIQREAGDEKRG